MGKKGYKSESYRGKAIERKGSKFRIYVGQRVTCDTLDAARSQIDKHLDKLAVVEKQIVKSSPVRVDEAFEKFIATKAAQNKRETTIRNYRQTLDSFKQQHPSLVWVHEITDELWERWITEGSSPEAQRELANAISTTISGKQPVEEFGIKVSGQWRVFTSLSELQEFLATRLHHESPPSSGAASKSA